MLACSYLSEAGREDRDSVAGCHGDGSLGCVGEVGAMKRGCGVAGKVTLVLITKGFFY